MDWLDSSYENVENKFDIRKNDFLKVICQDLTEIFMQSGVQIVRTHRVMRIDYQKICILTGKRQKKAQAAWFLKFLGVDIPCDHQGPILTDAVYEKLLEKRLGLGPSSTTQEQRPAVRLVNKK